jgi:hypothetical protein
MTLWQTLLAAVPIGMAAVVGIYIGTLPRTPKKR